MCNPKMNFITKKTARGFSFLSFLWEIQTKLFLRTAVSHTHVQVMSTRLMFTRTVFQFLFWISQLKSKEGNPQNLDFKFTLKTDFCFQILLLLSGFQNLNTDFSIKHRLH